MIRLALPKGRNRGPAIAALTAAGLDFTEFQPTRLRQRLAEFEILLLKDADLPLYVEQGIADCGVMGTDVLEEAGADLLTPLSLADGGCRISIIGKHDQLPPPGAQVRVASKYPRWSRRLLASRPWNVDVLPLHGSVELGPLLDLVDFAIDIVQTGTTIREHALVEIERLSDISPLVVVNRASFLRHRSVMNAILRRLEEAGVCQ